MTLKSIVDNLSPEEASDCLVIVFVADTDPEFVSAITSDVRREFGPQIDSGLIEVSGSERHAREFKVIFSVSASP